VCEYRAMRKLPFPTLITESLAQLTARERKESVARLRIRVQLLRLLKTQEVASIKAASRQVGLTAKRGYELWSLYQAKGLDGLLQLNYKPRQSKLSNEQQTLLVRKAGDGTGFGSQQEVREFLHREFQVNYTQAGVCLLFQRLKIKAKVPRPENVAADKDAQMEYKKSLPTE
jgi:transposase